MESTSTDRRAMKAWEINIPIGNEYAYLLPLYEDPPESATLCSSCKATERESSLLVEWEDGSDIIGDFIAAHAKIVVRSKVADELLKRFSGFEKGRVEMYDHPNLRRSKKMTKKTLKRVWLPYEGPELSYMFITREVPLLPQSTVTVESKCKDCGAIIYESFDGIEEQDSRTHIPRKLGKGFFFRLRDLQGDDFFLPKYTGFSLCTDRAKEFIQRTGYTNVEFLEVGDILDI